MIQKPKMDDPRAERSISPKFEQRLRWMETESRFAYSCPDLDQEFDYENQAQGQGQRQRLLMPWQRWLSLVAGLISLGVILNLVLAPVTMESLETIHLWLALAILALAVAVGAELHHHHARLTDIEKDR